MPEDWRRARRRNRPPRVLSAVLAALASVGCATSSSQPATGPSPPAEAPASEAAITSETELSPSGSQLGEAADPFALPPEEGAGTELGAASDPFAGPLSEGDQDRGQDEAGLLEEGDPFAAGGSALAPEDSDFDPDAVEVRLPPPGFEVHGRASLALVQAQDYEAIEQVRGLGPDMSAIDLYVQWFPTHWFGVVAEIEGESDLEEDERELEPELEALAAELRPLSNERIRLRVGFSPVVFGLERRYYAPQRNLFVNRPAVFRRLYPGTYADAGVFFWFNESLWDEWGGSFEIEVSLTRGLRGAGRDGRPSLFDFEDDNGEPQASSRIGLTLLDVDPARPGPSSLPFSARLTLGASILLGNYDSQARRRIRFVGFDAELLVAGFEARFEYVERMVEEALGTSRGRGLYAIAAYRWRPRLSFLEEAYLAFRYGVLDPDEDTDGSFDLERYHLGAGWSPYPGVLAKLGAEWTVGAHGARERALYSEIGVSF